MNIKVLGSSSKGNCYVVSDGTTMLLLDCGVPIRRILSGIDFKVGSVAGCLVTHSHGDHVKSAHELMFRGIPVYASAGCIRAANLAGAVPVESMKMFTVGTFRVLPFDIQHDAPEPLGFLLKSTITDEKLLYFTDTYYLKYKFSGITHILCEANYDPDILLRRVELGEVPGMLADRVISSHMSIDHLEDFLRVCDLSKLRKIWLCHLSDGNSNAAEFLKRIQRLTGVEVEVS
jgi:phosphoribosyl 1,2-cyclic phosphodiesterase